MANVQVKVDDQLKMDAQLVASNIGLDLASAVRMFLKQMVRENGLPFRPGGDPFYSPQNMAHLRQAIQDYKEGKNFSYHDLIEVEDEE